ncbi:MAG: orotidine 5'-phosphate decarboxylase / HUMPS family protein, partial [Candidatus Altiarchaeota archaeon]|nr:orotidine 5'-phosphate decarboxylase / HUMPS family protein [Candidatus Altiarchaeota archaeon]
MAEFLEKYNKARGVKNSVLCIGLDPSPGELDGADILSFCLDMVERTSDYAVAYKPNTQFILFTLNLTQLKKLNEEIHNAGCVSILDHKLGDIGSSNEAAFYWIAKAGFDALTL